MKKDRVELIGLIMSIVLAVIIIVLAFGTICQLLNTSSTARIELDHLADKKARCDSIGGQFGAEKCYKDGKEMFLGGEE